MDICARVVERKQDACRFSSVEVPSCEACRTMGGCLGQTSLMFPSLLSSVGWMRGYDFPVGALVVLSVPDAWLRYLLLFSLMLPLCVLVVSAALFTAYIGIELWVVALSILCFFISLYCSPRLFSYFVTMHKTEMSVRLK